jgi:hypothetical protein
MAQALFHLGVEIVVIMLIYLVVAWVMKTVGAPEPFNKIVLVIFVVIAAILILAFLLPLAGLHF